MSRPPLADRLRPKSLDDVVGQAHLLDENGPLSRLVAAGQPTSLILWGPPGCGKTTIARLYAQAFGADFHQLSAVFSGVADLKKVVEKARANRGTDDDSLFGGNTAEAGGVTVLFVDEIHRFNKAQQDAFLPYVEDGTLVLVGATTENPSFELNGALLSRARVVRLNPLDEAALETLLARAEEEAGALNLSPDARAQLLALAGGDGRYLLNLAETLASVKKEGKISAEEMTRLLQARAPLYDKAGEGHYNLISALHKAVRGSDVDAALYWLARMLVGGEDPRYLARRLIRMATEDIGLADPAALAQTIAARETYETLGSPEGELALAQAVVYLASAPKSNAVYMAFKAAMKTAKKTGELPPPPHSLNAPTKLMEAEGYGKGYIYDHDTPHGVAGQSYFPEKLPREPFYLPVERGFEKEITKRIKFFNKVRKEHVNS